MKAGEFFTPQQISSILSGIVTLDSQEPKTGKKSRLDSVLDFPCGSGSLLLNARKRMGPHGIGKIFGQEKNITTYNLARMIPARPKPCLIRRHYLPPLTLMNPPAQYDAFSLTAITGVCAILRFFFAKLASQSSA